MGRDIQLLKTIESRLSKGKAPAGSITPESNSTIQSSPLPSSINLQGRTPPESAYSLQLVMGMDTGKTSPCSNLVESSKSLQQNTPAITIDSCWTFPCKFPEVLARLEELQGEMKNLVEPLKEINEMVYITGFECILKSRPITLLLFMKRGSPQNQATTANTWRC
jgi:hypothetical protein